MNDIIHENVQVHIECTKYIHENVQYSVHHVQITILRVKSAMECLRGRHTSKYARRMKINMPRGAAQ